MQKKGRIPESFERTCPVCGAKYVASDKYNPRRTCGRRCAATLSAHPKGQSANKAEYGIWASMWTRCTNPNAQSFPLYGGRGITVCERWRTFANFLDDMGRRPSSMHSIDRYPNADGNYEPGNVRWATQAQQNRNNSRTRLLTHDGKTMCLTDWAGAVGLNASTLWDRLRARWPLDEALTVPAGQRRRSA